MHLHEMHRHKMLTHQMQMHGIIDVVPAIREDAVVGAWHELLDRHARVQSALERALEEKHGLGVTEFEVLDRLAGREEDACRLQELVGSLHLSQSALSRAVARLEADGLVKRAICDYDRRGIFAQLTAAGRKRHAQALPTHREVLREQLG
jgi:DNA-binding MarR family transcriptional regulator